MSAELAGIALDVARAAAELVRGRAAQGVTVAATKSSDVDVVTEADRASEALIHRLLAERRPDDGFLGEEGSDAPGRSGVRWVIDPIDGTVNFLYGIPQYAVSIAAERDGEVVAGVVLNVATGTEYVAHAGPDGTSAATRDGEPLAVRAPAPLQQRLVATGFSYDAGLRELQARALVRMLPRVRDIRRLGLLRPGPVPRGGGVGRRLRGGGREPLGPRRGRAGRPGGRCPHRADDRGGWSRPVDVRSDTRLRGVPRPRPSGGLPGRGRSGTRSRIRGIGIVPPVFMRHVARPVCTRPC